MPSSVAHLVRRAVTDGLANEPGLRDEGVAVSYGYDVSATKRFQVFTAQARADTPPAALRSGRNHKDEQGMFSLLLVVNAPGGDAFAAEERSDQFRTVVEEFLGDRKSNELGVPGLSWLRLDGWATEDGRADEGWPVVTTYTVRYQARIT